MDPQEPLVAPTQEDSIPTNKEIIDQIESIQNVANNNRDNLSEVGQQLIDDTNNILDVAKRIFKEKNPNGEIQAALFHAIKATEYKEISQRRAELIKLIDDVDGEEVIDDTVKNVKNIFVIIKLIFSSLDFRYFLSDFIHLVKEVMRKRKMDKLQQQITQISTNPAPDPATYQLQQHQLTNHLINQSLLNPAPVEIQAVVPQVNPAHLPAEDVPEQHRKLQQIKQVSHEIEESVLHHWSRMIISLHQHPEYRDAIQFIASSISSVSHYFSEHIEQIETAHKEEKKQVENVEAKTEIDQAWINAKSFIENWIGDDYSLNKLLQNIHHLSEKAKEDEELREFFHDVSYLIQHTVVDDSYANNAIKIEMDANALIYRGRCIFHQRYEQELKTVVKELQFLVDTLQHDEEILELEEKFSKLIRDAFTDKKGFPTFHPELISDLQILAPGIISSLRALRIPPLEMKDDESEFTLTGGLLDCSQITPSSFRVAICGDMVDGKPVNYIQILVSQIRVIIRNGHFHFVKKAGFPQFEESGVATMAIHGERGLTIDLHLLPNVKTNDNGVSSLFSVKYCKCTISKFNIRLHNTKHDFLYKLLGPLINLRVKPDVEGFIRDAIIDLVQQGNEKAKSVINAPPSVEHTAPLTAPQVDPTPPYAPKLY